MKDLDKMTFDEIKQYVKELEEFKAAVIKISPFEIRNFKNMQIKKRIEDNPFGKFSELIKID